MTDYNEICSTFCRVSGERLLQEALEAGLAVLLLSTDFDEVASLCRRTLVFVRGTVTAELSGPALTVAELTRAASALPPSTARHS